MLTFTFFPTPARALWSKHVLTSASVDSRQSVRASRALRKMSTSDPMFDTLSFHVKDGSTFAVWTRLDSSGPAVQYGPGFAGGSSVQPAARSVRRSVSFAARFMSACVWCWRGAFGSTAATAATATVAKASATRRMNAKSRTNLGSHTGAIRRGLVAEIRPEPALGLLHRDALARGVVGDLVGPETADGEVAHFRMREIDAADAGSRSHRIRLRERDPDLVGCQ